MSRIDAMPPVEVALLCPGREIRAIMTQTTRHELAPQLISQEFVTRFVALLALAGVLVSFMLLLVAMSMYPDFSLVSHTLSRLGRQSLVLPPENYFGQPVFNAAYILGASTLVPMYMIFARGSHVSGQKKARNAFCCLIIAASGLIGAGILTDDDITFRYHLSQSGTFFVAAAFACIFFIWEWWGDGRGARKWAVAYLVFLASNVAMWIVASSDIGESLGWNDGVPEFFSFVSFYVMNVAFVVAMLARGPAIPMSIVPRNRLDTIRKKK
ncbi:MAG: DUF998 domain-containing protein [Candidatus Lokiarchaeota archaeon]|nr:DUF998 domain-containing protein [Candidatus Lokiarchaeota archaeon]